MKLSSKARYGLKAMAILAEDYEKGIVTLGAIAEKSELSLSYLEQLLASLRKAGLVNTIRGTNGGYQLAKAPCEITVGEIVRTLEDDLQIVDCINGNCNSKCRCKTHSVWQKLYDAINNTLDGITLESLL